jgi:hypothetical protein
VGTYLRKANLPEASAQELRSQARNELIACLAWIDLQGETLVKGRGSNREDRSVGWSGTALSGLESQ